MHETSKLFGNFEKSLEIFDENVIEKLNFYIFLGKVVAKNRAFGNNIIFLQHFFPFWWGGCLKPPNPPAHATGSNIYYFTDFNFRKPCSNTFLAFSNYFSLFLYSIPYIFWRFWTQDGVRLGTLHSFIWLKCLWHSSKKYLKRRESIASPRFYGGRGERPRLLKGYHPPSGRGVLGAAVPGL